MTRRRIRAGIQAQYLSRLYDSEQPDEIKRTGLNRNSTLFFGAGVRYRTALPLSVLSVCNKNG